MEGSWTGLGKKIGHIFMSGEYKWLKWQRFGLQNQRCKFKSR